MRKTLMAVLVLGALILPAVTGNAQQILVSVHGSRKFQSTVKRKQVTASQPVTNATILKTFGLSAKTNVVVFDTGGALLKVVPKAGGAGVNVLGLNNSLTSYNTDSPKSFTEYGNLAAQMDAVGSEFDSLSGVIIFKISQTPANVPKGVSATVVAGSTANSPFFLYTISFAGTKTFVP